MNIYPTHKCFDDTIELLVEILSAAPARTDDLRLVHGICLMPEDGHAYAHAWLEDDRRDTAIFVGILHGEEVAFETDRFDYRAGLQVQEWTRYTVTEAWRENSRHKTYGPWIKRYMVLCRNAERD